MTTATVTPGLTWLVILCVAVLGSARAAEPFGKKTYGYKVAGEVAIRADVYRASDDKMRPALVWIHGGALIVGSRADVPAQLLYLCKREGFILISLDYRLAPEVKLPAIAEDIRDAFRWIHKEGPRLFQVDLDRIVVSGGSAGGYLTLLAGTSVKPRPKALVAYWGYGDVDGPWYTTPSEFYRKKFPLLNKDEVSRAVGDKVLTGTTGDTGKARGLFYRYLRQNGFWTKEVSGFDPKTDRARLDPFCPVRNVTADYPPTLLIHGTEDDDVPYEQSAAMDKELTRHKVPHELITVRGAGHGLSGGDKKAVADAHDKALAFIRKHLKDEK